MSSLPFAHASLGVAIFGGLIQAVLAIAYLRAASKPSPRGNRWPYTRTLCFVSGLTLFSLAVQSPLAVHDELRWFHSAQHLVVMMVVPPLLVLGSPITLMLRRASPRMRREIVGILQDPAMKRFSGPITGVGLTLEYHGTMFLVMLTGLYGYTLTHEWAHILTHSYLFLCGLLFWMPLVGRDPAGFRPSYRAKLVMVASGLPAYVLLGALMSGRDTSAAWVLGAGGVALTLAGVVLIGSGGAPWSNRRMFATSKAMKMQQAIDPKR